MRVLIADDSDLILERLSEMLIPCKQLEIVASLKNGTDALNALRTLKPEIAIMDIRMPGLTGLEVLTEIRKEDSSTKIIILSFYSSDYYRTLANQAGADYFFNKADEFNRVFLAVSDIISNANTDAKTSNEKSVKYLTD